MLRSIPLLLAAALAFGCPAAAAAESAPAPMPTLKAQASVARTIVRIGDLIDNAGDAGDIAIFRAPDLGETGAVPTARVVEAARRHGLARIETNGLTEVVVSRPAREIDRKAIERHIVAALAANFSAAAADDLTVTFDQGTPPLLVEATAGEPGIVRARYDRYSGRYDVTFSLPGGGTEAPRTARFTGTIAETAAVAVALRPLGRGDVIRAEDVTIERHPKATVRPNAVSSLDQVVGLAARRPLRPGQALAAADLMRPELVVKNEAVTIVYEAPGMVLSVRGKAMESGAEGDLISVFNAQTKRTLQGVVAGPGRVAIVATFATSPAPEITGSIAAKAQPSRAE
jgi:flagella basal body P-ring formation protein FlgA